MWSHTVAILIGGQSTRMGTPKQYVELPNGKTMLETMLEFAQSVTSSIVVVGSEVKGIRSIYDQRDKQGPVAGIEALLHSEIDDKYLVVGCDMPFIRSEDVQPLLQCEQTALFLSNERLFPLPLLIDANELDSCTDYLQTGKRSIHGFIESIPHLTVPIDQVATEALKSINSPEDFAELYPQA